MLTGQVLGAAEPSGHPNRFELRPRRVEQRPRAPLVARRAAPELHPRLVKVCYGAQRPRPLLLQNGAHLREPFGGFVVAFLEGAKVRHR